METLESKSSSLLNKSSKDKMEIKILGCILQGKFPVYTVQSKNLDKILVMKVFPLTSTENKNSYNREARLAHLDHPNIIPIFEIEAKKKTVFKGKSIDVAYTIMEFAPYGDFSNVIQNPNILRNEKLMRTYFYQLFNGLQYLHSIGLSHLDLKPENLLLSENYTLKIADLESCFSPSQDKKVPTTGTKNFRAPELINSQVVNAFAADIYSLGILLFVMITGSLPFSEDKMCDGVQSWEEIQKHPSFFWSNHSLFLGDFVFSEEFKELFEGMTRAKAEERFLIEDISKSSWLNLPRYSEEELFEIMKNYKLKQVKPR